MSKISALLGGNYAVEPIELTYLSSNIKSGERIVSEQIDIRKVARLGALSVDEHDQSAVLNKLTAMVAMFDALSAIDTTDIEPMAHPLEQIQRLRDDVVSEQDIHAYVQQIAPKVEAGLYLVPKVIE